MTIFTIMLFCSEDEEEMMFAANYDYDVGHHGVQNGWYGQCPLDLAVKMVKSKYQEQIWGIVIAIIDGHAKNDDDNLEVKCKRYLGRLDKTVSCNLYLNSFIHSNLVFFLLHSCETNGESSV